jgi:hypothetical protein
VIKKVERLKKDLMRFMESGLFRGFTDGSWVVGSLALVVDTLYSIWHAQYDMKCSKPLAIFIVIFLASYKVINANLSCPFNQDAPRLQAILVIKSLHDI